MSKSHRRGIRRERRRLRIYQLEAIERRFLLSSGGFTAGGIHGYYYNSTDLTGPVAFDRQDVRIDFDWGTVLTPGGSNSPGFDSIGHDNFSVQWIGQIVAGNSQTYTFETLTDSGDGAQLLLRPAGSSTWTTVIDDWAGGVTTATGTFAMTAGATYDIEMNYYHTTGAAEASLHWSSASMPDQVIGPLGITGINAATYGGSIYADAMKSGRDTWEGNAPQDASGWPLEDATNIPWEGVDPASVAGTYLLSFSGEATVTADVGGLAVLTVNGTQYDNTLPDGVGYDAATNTTTATITLTASNAGILSLEFTNSQRTASSATDTGVTNVQLMKPTSPGASTYYPLRTLFTTSGLAAMSAFTTERWLTTNDDTTQVNWSDRVLPSYFKANITNSEVWEDLVMFANETGKDLYITIPVNASSAYVTDLAELIKYGSDGVNPYTSYQANPVYPGLNPNLNVYVEWSNEIWNPGFTQHQAAVQDSALAVEDNTPEGQIINYDGSSPSGNWERWAALMTVEASNDFRAVWGDAAMGTSVRILLEYQYYNLQDTAYNELGFINDYFDNGDGAQHVTNPEPVSYYIWGAGGPNYYGFNNPTGAQSAITVPDFSFETPVVAPGTVQVDPTGAGWTFSGNAGIYNLGTGSSQQISAIGTPPTPSNGSQASFIGDTGSMSTTIDFTGTGVFAIQLDGADKANSPNAIDVYLNGQEITPDGDDYEPTYVAWSPGDAPGYNYTQYNTLDTAPFTISTPGSYTLTLIGTGAVGTYTYLDNIKVASDDALFNSGMQGVATVDTYQAEQNLEARYAEEYGLNVVAYEGGWDDVGSPLLSYAEFVDPRAEQTTLTSIDDFAEAGGTLFMMGTYASWPVDQMEDAPTSPVYEAVESADATIPPARTTPAPHLFFDTDQPATDDQNVYNSAIASSGGAELGMEIASDEAGYITGVRFWAGTQNTGVHTGELWSDNGQLLATATFSSETTGGWQLVYFSSPVVIAANTTYIVSYHTTSPYISDTPGAFSGSGITNLNLTGLANGVDGPNGVYSLGATSAFPNLSDGTSPNYWVDAIFSDHFPVAPSAPFNVTATVNSQTQVTITWTDSAGEVTEYDIERSTNGVNFTPIGSVYEQFQYVDTTAQPGTTYYYQVSAQNAGSHSPDVVVQATTPGAPKPTGTAAFLTDDTTTQGNWTTVYGADGYQILGSESSGSLPSYAQLSVTGDQTYIWQQSTTDPRAPLTAPNSSSRIASCDYAANSFTLNLNLTDGQMHEVALYLLDDDDRDRSETVQVIDAGTGDVLDTRSISNFSGGQWLVWNLSGNLQITITDNSGSLNGVASAIAFGGAPTPPVATSTAAFVSTDTATGGSWGGDYGADGYEIIGGQTSLPSYAQLSISGDQTWTWAASTTDPRAPQISPTSSSRVAACDYSATSITINLNLTDDQTHRVGLYMVDYDGLGRSQAVQIADAATGAVLDTRTVSNFAGGEWLFWDLSGDVTITITNTGGRNAVLSGIVFDPPAAAPKATASFAASDTTTSGSWGGEYGSDGYSIIGGQTSLPTYAQMSLNGDSIWTWAASTTAPSAAQVSPTSSNRAAACDYSATNFTIDLNLTDGQTHRVGLYMVDFDNLNRAQTIQIADAASGTILDTRSISQFTNGDWLFWNLSGDVTITITNTGGRNAVLSGIVFDPVPAAGQASASYVKTDTTTLGQWSGVYGSNGYSIFNSGSSLPSYATLTTSSAQTYTWVQSTTDSRALQTAPGASTRIAACDYASTSFALNLDLTDGQTHQIALYLVDFDRQNRSETVQVSDAVTGTVLDTRTVSNFSGGEYLVWDLSGNLKITITSTAGVNGVASGIFFDPTSPT